MITFPNAKINIGLNVVEKRLDGYHNLESVFMPIGLCDALEVIEYNNADNEAIVFSKSGIDIPDDGKPNLCQQAYALMAQDISLPQIKVHLHKNIPIGAGLGGGSADAAFFIKLLNEQFNLNLSQDAIMNYARKLGSDCAFFIPNSIAYIEGTGTEFTEIKVNLKGKFITVVYPHIHVSTAQAYAGITPQKASRSLSDDVCNLAITEWKGKVHNDFEDSLFKVYPRLEKIKRELYNKGALYASMSGSGSSIYGLFDAPTRLSQDFPDCFVWEGAL